MVMSDPSRLLIFYTYSPDNEQAEVGPGVDWYSEIDSGMYITARLISDGPNPHRSFIIPHSNPRSTSISVHVLSSCIKPLFLHFCQVNKAQDSIVEVKMPELDDSFRKPDIGGNGVAATNTKFPVQLYCRSRPWFQVRGLQLYCRSRPWFQVI